MKTKYPCGSPKDILVKLRKIERDVKQMLTDIQSVNDNNPNFAEQPMDVGRYLVQLKKIRGVIENVKSVIAAGLPMLPKGMLDPICEEW